MCNYKCAFNSHNLLCSFVSVNLLTVEGLGQKTNILNRYFNFKSILRSRACAYSGWFKKCPRSEAKWQLDNTEAYCLWTFPQKYLHPLRQ